MFVDEFIGMRMVDISVNHGNQCTEHGNGNPLVLGLSPDDIKFQVCDYTPESPSTGRNMVKGKYFRYTTKDYD